VARAVTRARAPGGRPVVVASGACLTALGTVAGLVTPYPEIALANTYSA
jgi:hypothetical protein